MLFCSFIFSPFNVGTHCGLIQSSTSGTYGSCNDKTIIRFDEYINEIRTEERYTEIEYDLMISETESVKQKGAFTFQYFDICV